MALNWLDDAADIDDAADRICTISEKDVKGLMRGCTPEEITTAVEKFRIAGDKTGDALAYAARARVRALTEG